MGGWGIYAEAVERQLFQVENDQSTYYSYNSAIAGQSLSSATNGRGYRENSV